MITALCGGVGGSKLALGLYRVLPPDSLNVIVNTADDLEFCGLHVSPDVDTVTYTLAGLSRPDVGWGIEGDSFGALDMLGRYGVDTWFQVGDHDLATHLYRTARLRSGQSLTEVTEHLARALDVRAAVLPMTEARVATRLLVHGEWIEFQEYFVHRRHQDPVEAIRYQGLEAARAGEGVVESLRAAEAVIIVNSNPVLSIVPILELAPVRELLRASTAPCVAVSPIVGDEAVAGPAGELMRTAGFEASAAGVAAIYAGLIDGLVIDRQDEAQAGSIEAGGVRVLCTDTIMRSLEDRQRLAREVLDFARSLE